MSPDVRDSQFAAQVNAFGGVGVLAFARGGIRIDVIAVAGQRGNVNSRALNLLSDGCDRGVIEFIWVQPELHAGKPFRLDELQVGIGELAQYAQFWFPIGDAVTLRLDRDGGGHGGNDSSAGNTHPMTILRSGTRTQLHAAGAGLLVPERFDWIHSHRLTAGRMQQRTPDFHPNITPSFRPSK